MQRDMWPSGVYADMAVLLLRGNEFEKMLEVLNFLLNSQSSVIGSVHPKRLKELFAACVTRGHTLGALVSCCFSLFSNRSFIGICNCIFFHF